MKNFSKFLLEQGFERDQIDTTLFIRTHGENILLVQIYVETLYLDLQINPYVINLII